MFKTIRIVTIAILVGSTSLAYADAKDDVVAAAKKLADSESYSWTTTAEGAAGMGGGSEGKTQDGLTMLVLTLRGGETARVIFKGEKGAFESPNGDWQAIDQAADEPGVGMMISNMVRTYQPPSVQAQNLASKAQDLQKTDDGSYTGALSAEDAKALMQRRMGRRGGAGGPGPEVKDPSATVRFWTDNGLLSKFQFHVQGTMTIQGEEREIDRTTTVQIKDVGTTTIDVPAEAKALME